MLLANFRASAISKQQFLELLESQTLISRKIWVAEEFYFHPDTVWKYDNFEATKILREIKLFDVLNIFTYLKIAQIWFHVKFIILTRCMAICYMGIMQYACKNQKGNYCALTFICDKKIYWLVLIKAVPVYQTFQTAYNVTSKCLIRFLEAQIRLFFIFSGN